ncbi:ribonuclease R [Roseiarcus fermentans]|uniref:Ribonuclease R n=1 Tax=Roseiarcus fermentans TaxID=1473586 RepID=A0A366FGH1_9HYPH|nr:ribonuclease R [Roseiarcus fermentans]RBP13773.1 ribonuclease R [Roseiarcus fermentans]
MPPRSALPSREEVIAFIGGAPAPNGEKPPARVTKRDIARAFGVTGEAKAGLKLLIKDLQSEGAIARGRKSLQAQGRLPSLVVADVAERDRDGELVAKPVEWDDEGPAPRILIRRSRVKRDSAPAPGLGARVLMRIEFNPDATGKEPAYTGRVVKILEKLKARTFAVFRRAEDGSGRALPVEKRAAQREFFVPAAFAEGAEDGDLVAIEPLRATRFGPPNARVVESIGSVKSEKAVSLIALAQHHIPFVFSPAALNEAETARPVRLEAPREDWRSLPLVTIDPPDAKDHDDAVHAAPDPDPANAGGFVVTVAIADVAAYVRPGAALDRDALERGNSVYFPDRVVPMLPERISNDLCSLRPLEDRPALAVRMILGADGRKRSHRFHRVMMRSAAKLSYEQAQAAIDGRTDETTAPLLDPVLKPLWAAHAAVKIERERRDPLDLDLPERKLLLDAQGRLASVRWPERLDAHRLIEEFMILANVAAAETLEAQHSPLLYRAHDSPSVEKLNDLVEFLGTIGVKLARGDRVRPSHFNGVLGRVKGQGVEALVNEVVLRAQAQAEYSHENYGHFGLNLRRYAHFTSPIRRYADLVAHRALIRALGLGEGGLQDMRAGELAQIAEHISAAERRAMAAERETVDRLVAAHLADRVGAVFEARVAGVTRVGLFVKLAESGADGFVPAATLGDDYFRFEEGIRALVGTRSGVTYRLGDTVRARLVEAAPFAGALRFEIVAAGGEEAPRRLRRARSEPSERKPVRRGARR